MTSSSDALTGKELRRAARAAIAAVEERELDPEDIKDLIVASNERFYLVPSANPQNTYRVLWFTTTSHSESEHRACKIDILIPGLLSIPSIPKAQISYIKPFHDIPTAPFLVVLLLKLRGWKDHRDDDRQRVRDKAEVDEGDIEEMLELSDNEYRPQLEREKQWLPKWFVEEAEDRVYEYMEEWPVSTESWHNIGF
ncbi:hypothetical protein H0H87_008445 [Tephrocybe sp. NHM501043]|nr:hypothetical protein H0H87_008445 [Tephrocybe sp. NHM501043]